MSCSVAIVRKTFQKIWDYPGIRGNEFHYTGRTVKSSDL